MKTVLITGSSRGIGRETAIYFAQQGWNVIIHGFRHPEKLESLKNEILEENVSCLSFCGDISDPSFVDEMIKQSLLTFSKIDCLVNNAGISLVGLFTDATVDDWNLMINTNLTSVFTTCKNIVPHMLHHHEGKIINISSIWGCSGASCEVAYSASKGGLNLFTKPQLFFKGDRFRIFGVFAYKNTLENFYGIGYSTNKDYPRGEDTSEYRYSGVQVNPWFLFRLGKSNFFAGPQIDFNYDKITKPAAGMIEQPSYIAAGGTDHGYSNLSSGLGFLLTYDTRDVPANAYRGTYLDFRGMMYNKAFGSDNNFYRLEIDYRQYKTLGKRKVLAWTVQTKNVFGNVPLTKYALSGTPFDLRGYYMGQFRDKSSHVMMAEYRQMINTDKSNWVKKMLNHVGYVAWGGCGFMGPTPGKIEGVLPNLGLGLRIEVQPRMNVRLDFGRDMVNKQNLFYFNMTEAF